MNVNVLVKIADKLETHQGDDVAMAVNAIDFALEDATTTDMPYESALASISNFANILDCDGFSKAAEILDIVLKTAVKATPKVSKVQNGDYSHLYDSKENNKQTFYNAVQKEVATATEPALDSLRGGGHPLLTRYSPDYPGVMLTRISDGVYQDMLSKKVYDFKNGFVSDTGIRYYGGSVAYQTPNAQNAARSPTVWESQYLKVRPQ